jgi:hypothetical protein
MEVKQTKRVARIELAPKAWEASNYAYPSDFSAVKISIQLNFTPILEIVDSQPEFCGSISLVFLLLSEIYLQSEYFR